MSGRREGNAPPSQRRLRVGEEIRHVLAEVIGRGELRDPALHDKPITVTEVRISPDLKNATAYIVPLGGEQSVEIMVGLKRSAGYLRTVIAHRLRLRYAPHLGFELDRTFDQAQHINELLHRPDVARDLAPHPDVARDVAPHDDEPEADEPEDGGPDKTDG
ncbi:MAG TPA: 30S ribosome-binding factor RbfA [Aliidongia sp.]|nr:30S ribosome-binding factor RbfA [Aliidongia sp.]